MSDKKHVIDFLHKLSSDSDLQEKFKADAHGTAAAHGLTQEDRDVLASGDSAKIEAHLGAAAMPKLQSTKVNYW